MASSIYHYNHRHEQSRNKETKLAMSEIALAYNSWSQTYETIENLTRDLAAKALRQQGLRLHDKDVLEIGCGTGLNTRYLAENCRSVAAVDFSEGMLEKARANVTASNVRFVQSDIRHEWNVESSSVDFIVCTLVLEHIKNLRHIFDEALRVLRTGGEFWFYELHPFRQLQGGQAQFKDAASDEVVFVQAYLHSVSEFVNTAIEAEFELARLDEWHDENNEKKNPFPRLLSIHVRIPHKHI